MIFQQTFTEIYRSVASTSKHVITSADILNDFVMLLFEKTDFFNGRLK
jgi:hypothetical protein